MKKSLRLNAVALSIAILMVLTTFSLSGCSSEPKEKAELGSSSLNDEIMLKTEQVEQLLKDNDIKLARDDSFDADKFTYTWNRSDTENPEFKPSAYKIDGSSDDIEILIYEFDEYISFNVAYNSISEKIDGLYQGFDLYSVYGKNIAVCPIPLYESKEDNAENSEAVQKNALSKLRNNIFEILYENAFNGEDVTYEGSQDGWSVIADVRQFNNVYSEGTSRDSISEYAYGEISIKRDGAQKADDILAKLESFTWNGSQGGRTFTKEELLDLKESEKHPGYFVLPQSNIDSTSFKYGTELYVAKINGDEAVIELKKK